MILAQMLAAPFLPWTRLDYPSGKGHGVGLVNPGGILGDRVLTQPDVKVLATTAMKTVFETLAPQFQAATGRSLAASFGPSVQIEKRLNEGEAADVAILPTAAANDMIARGKVLPGSLVDIARSSLGVAVQRGAPKPDISSVEAFKRALLAAKSVATSRPVGAGLSGAHMAKVFQDLGIAEAMAAKLKYGSGGVSGLVGLIVERGEAEIGVQQIAELKAVAGVDFVGPLPAALQAVTPFTAAIPTAAVEIEAGRKLIDFLVTPQAKRVIEAKGLEPT
jgi:molybdate transport system substrate-binding protein